MPCGYLGLKIFTSLSLRFHDFQRMLGFALRHPKLQLISLVGRNKALRASANKAFPAFIPIVCRKRQHALRLGGLIPAYSLFSRVKKDIGMMHKWVINGS